MFFFFRWSEKSWGKKAPPAKMDVFFLKPEIFTPLIEWKGNSLYLPKSNPNPYFRVRFVRFSCIGSGSARHG